MRYAHADRMFSCPRSFSNDQLCVAKMAKKHSEMDEDLPSEAEEQHLLGENDDEDESPLEDREKEPKYLKKLTEVLTNMSTSMLEMTQSLNRMNRGKTSDFGGSQWVKQASHVLNLSMTLC